MIKIEGLRKSFGALEVLKGIDLTVNKGEVLCMIGGSGSGKSTLLMVMAGLERVDEGRVLLAGEDFSKLDEDGLAAFRGRNIGIVFQSFHLIPNMTALENVAVPLELAGDDNAFERAAQELTAVGLGERLSHYPAQMSGGEQQRVAIARAIAKNPTVLFCDEPTGDLERLQQALKNQWEIDHITADLTAIRKLQPVLRKGQWQVTVALHKDHISAFQQLGNSSTIFLGGLATDFRVGAGAKALGDITANLQRFSAIKSPKRLRIGIGTNEVHAVNMVIYHVANRVTAAATHSNHLDNGTLWCTIY